MNQERNKISDTLKQFEDHPNMPLTVLSEMLIQKWHREGWINKNFIKPIFYIHRKEGSPHEFKVIARNDYTRAVFRSIEEAAQ